VSNGDTRLINSNRTYTTHSVRTHDETVSLIIPRENTYVHVHASEINSTRSSQFDTFEECGGVLLVGYDQYRNLTQGKMKDAAHKERARVSHTAHTRRLEPLSSTIDCDGTPQLGDGLQGRTLAPVGSG